MSNFEERNKFFDAMCSDPDLMWLGQNTNHFTPDPSVRQAVIDALDSESYHAYAPPLGFEELRALIREDMGLPEACVMVTDGGVQALFTAIHRLCPAGKDFITTDPSWAWPMEFARRAGANVVQIPVFNREAGYKLTVEQLRERVGPNTGMIYLVDPNNPLGTCHTEEEIRAFTDIAREVGAYFIHDTTYCHFADSFTPAARFYPERTLMIYSFSKWLGLAGMRLGAVLSSAEIVSHLASAPANNLGSNVLSQKAAIAGLRSKADWFPAIRARLRRNQAAVWEAVQKVPGLDVAVYPSQGNFLVIECTEAGVTPEALAAAFRTRNIMVRHGRYHTQNFGERFIKVSLSVPEAWADAFCEALPEMVELARTLPDDQALF
jgi:aspartate aminotransferase